MNTSQLSNYSDNTGKLKFGNFKQEHMVTRFKILTLTRTSLAFLEAP